MQFWLKRFLSIPNRIGSGKETDLKRTGNGFRKGSQKEKLIAKGETDLKRICSFSFFIRFQPFAIGFIFAFPILFRSHPLSVPFLSVFSYPSWSQPFSILLVSFFYPFAICFLSFCDPFAILFKSCWIRLLSSQHPLENRRIKCLLSDHCFHNSSHYNTSLLNQTTKLRELFPFFWCLIMPFPGKMMYECASTDNWEMNNNKNKNNRYYKNDYFSI